MFLGMTVMSGRAQRTTDVIDRGLVAVKTGSGIFCSWRVTAEEYYDVTYNILSRRNEDKYRAAVCFQLYGQERYRVE